MTPIKKFDAFGITDEEENEINHIIKNTYRLRRFIVYKRKNSLIFTRTNRFVLSCIVNIILNFQEGFYPLTRAKFVWFANHLASKIKQNNSGPQLWEE